MFTSAAIIWIVGDMIIGGMMINTYLDYKKTMNKLKKAS